MTNIEKAGDDLIADLEMRVDQDNVDIVHFARERDQRIGYPNLIDNVLVPLWNVLTRRPLQNYGEDLLSEKKGS